MENVNVDLRTESLEKWGRIWMGKRAERGNVFGRQRPWKWGHEFFFGGGGQ